MEQETATIEVRRSEDDARDRGRSYRIEIDGTRVGTLSRGETAAPTRVVVAPAGLPYAFWPAFGDRYLRISEE